MIKIIEGDSYKGLQLVKNDPKARLAEFAMINEVLEQRRVMARRSRLMFLPEGFIDPRSLLDTDELVEEYIKFEADPKKIETGRRTLESLDEQTTKDLRAAWWQCQDWYSSRIWRRDNYQGPGPDYC